MRRRTRITTGLALCLSLMLGPALLQAAQDSLLVVVRSSQLSQLRSIRTFVPYFVTEAEALGSVAPEDTAQLRQVAEAVTVLPRVDRDKPLFWLHAKETTPAAIDLKGVRVLVSGTDEAIVQADVADIARLAASGVQPEIIDWTPKQLPTGVAWAPLGTVAYDSSVAAIVEQVSPDAIRAALQRLQDFRTRYTYSDSIIPAGQWIYDQFVSFGYTEVRFDTFYIQGVPHRNVIAVKRGVIFPDSVIMLGGHYDSIVLGAGARPYEWAPGVDDNGSGTVAALEAARVLADHQFEATIQFAAWDAEEIGLVGSSAYAAEISRTKEPLSFYMNFDMIANLNPGSTEWSVRIFSDWRAQPFAEFMAEVARTYTTLTPLLPGNSGGSDHRPFQQHGYPAVFVHETDFSPHWHKPTDTIDNANVEYGAEVIRLGVATAVELAGLADNFGHAPYAKYVAHSLDDDQSGSSLGNGNGFVDAGERLEIWIQAKNYGTQTAQGLRAKITTDDPYVTVLVDSVSFPDAAPQALVDANESFVIAVAPATPNGRKLDFVVQTIDAFDHSWQSRFSLRVQMPKMEFVHQVASQKSGDGDDKVEALELWNLRVRVRNAGLRDAAPLTGILRSLGPELEVQDSVASFGRVDRGGFAENFADSLIVRVSPSAQVGQIVPLELVLREEGGFYEDRVRFNLAIGQGSVLLVEDNGDDGFSDYYSAVLNRSGIPFRHWDTAIEGPVPVDTLRKYQRTVWFVGTEYGSSLFRDGTENLETYLADGGRLFLTGPGAVFVLRTRPLFTEYLKVGYVHHYSALHLVGTKGSNEVLGDLSFWLASEGPNKQGMPTEISVSGDARPILYYLPNPTEGNGDIRADGIAAAAIATDVYRAVYFAFGWEGIAEETMRAEVLHRVLNWLQMDVAGVLDLASALPLNPELFQNFPNPFNPETRITYAIPKKGRVRITVRDLRGRLVRVLVDEEKTAGRHSVVWDGRDSAGRVLPSGLYFYRIEAGDFESTRKMLLIR